MESSQVNGEVVTATGHDLEVMTVTSHDLGFKTVTSHDLDEIWTWNSTVPATVSRCLDDIFEERVECHPHAPAVCAWDGQLTYGELDMLAARLAWKLVELGVGPQETIVPLCFDKSMWTTVAVLGVLKAGGAFLLLDPCLPEKRLQLMVRRVKARLVLTSVSAQCLGSRLAQDTVVVGTGLFTGLKGGEPGRQLPHQNPASLMYVSFTSGSTGAPKCIRITHSNVASALHHQVDIMGLTQDSRVLDFASYSFTTAISNFSGALAAGGCLCVPSDHDRRDRLPEAIRSLRANFIDLTPSVLQFLVPEDVPTLQVVVLGGEALRVRDVKSWWAKVRTIHLYGQSECTSNGTINHDASSPEAVLSIGKGAGLVTWIVDAEDHDTLVPVGCVGELLFEGPLIGDGYLDDPERTEAAFIEDPGWLLQGAPGRPGRHGRLYKTGDLVRYGENGKLVFLGRKDTQVKIRGQRVELGEVEHWVQSCMLDAVQVVAEVIQPQGEGSSRALVAFLQTKEEHITGELGPDDAKLVPIPPDVEDKLAGHLPNYMVPAAFFSVRELPMTATGKVDRKRLREIGALFSVESLAEMRTAGQGPKRQPTTAAEMLLRETWARVLRIGPAGIGLDDSFFHLGGDSIAAIKVVAEARKMGFGLAVADMFRHPTLQGLGRQMQHVERLSEEHIPPFALLDDVEDVASFLGDISGLFHLDPARIVDVYPCAPLQEGLFSLASKQSGNYVMQDVLQLSPKVAVSDLCSAWDRVTRAMPILRTRMVEHNGGLLQVVMDQEDGWIDATGLEGYLEADRKRPMGLGEPLTRFALVRDDTGSPRWFVWTMHHAIYDGWSIRLVMAAVHRAMQGLSIEQGPQVQAFVKYINTVVPNKYIDTAVPNYWVEALAGYRGEPFPALPPSVAPPAADTEAEHRFRRPRRRLTDMTTATVVHAAWALIIGRMSNTEDVVFGATVSGRNAPVAGIDAMVAPTFATIPVRVKVPGHRSVSAYLKTVQQQAVDAIPHEQAGLHRIAVMSPDCQRACAFQSLLVMQPQDTGVDVLENWQDTGVDVLGTWQATKRQWFNTYALMLDIRPAADTLVINASFDSGVLEPWLVHRLLTRLEFVMKQLDAPGDATLADMVVMTPQDSEQIWRWNRVVPAPMERCAHQMIQDRVLAQPAAPAICAWDGELSYRELDRLSSRLVGRLVELGVKPNVLVPLCFEKSMWTPVAMLGVLKAGGGFVLLDASLPQQRLQNMVGQLDAGFIVSSPTTLSLSSGLSPAVLQLDPKSMNLLDDAPRPAPVQPAPTDAMFAVFTSGSTGEPKGAVLSHVNFCSALKHQSRLLGLDKDSRLFDFASYAFDVAVHNVMATLASGGCVCIPADHERRDNISNAMARTGATMAELTPSVARLVDPATVPQLNTLILSGEAVSVDDITPWWGKTRLVNAYGPAECGISTISRGQSSPEHVISIGKGAGLVTWVVDPGNHNSLLPPGDVGELVLEGPLVGRGYLDDPEKTARSFIEDPAWLLQGPPSPGQTGRHGRLYKTGDLVRYHEDGSLGFVGRKDAQVKIRGQRVELGEVEHWVQHLTDAKHVVAEVVMPRGEGSSPALAAFLQMRDEPDAPDLGILTLPVDVEDRLTGHLPSYMMPAVFFLVRELPLTPTGKTDRRRLRELGSSFKERIKGVQGPKHEPTSDAERQMQAIWAKVLGIEPGTIGADDGFIKLGGNSISAMAVAGEARKLGLDVAVADMFRHPKLHQLAATVLAGTASTTIPSLAPCQGAEQSFAQQGLWASNRLHPRLPWHLTPWAVRLRGSLRLDALKTALFVLERRHDALRTTFEAQGGVGMQRIRPFQDKELSVVDVSPDAQGLELALQRTTPFDLEAEPGWRVTVYRIDEQEHVLSVVTHQIAADGWSLDLVRRELAVFYSAALDGQDPLAQVDSLPIQYRDYSAWQRQPSQMRLQRRQLDYWTGQLGTSRPAEFPCDHPRPETLSGETAALETRIDGRLHDELQRFCRERQVTLFVVLLAAFRGAHCRLTGATDATVGTASANRDRWETRELVGPLVNVQCIRIKVENESFDELVRQVQATTITSFANQHVPFERVVSELQADRDRSRHPLVQTLFAVHARSSLESFALEGVETEQIALPVTSRFDIEFHLYQEEEAVRGSLIFSTDLYASETIGNVLSVFRAVLERGLADPTLQLLYP